MSVLITTQPQNTAVEEGVPAFFDVVATGTGVLTYQWYITTTGAISGAVSNALAIGGVSLSLDGNQYYVLVTDDDDTVQSSTATLDVLPSTDCPGYACNAVSTAILAAAPDSYYPCDNGWDGLSTPDGGPVAGGDLLFDTVGTMDLVTAISDISFDAVSTPIYDACVGATSMHSDLGATFRANGAASYQYLTGGTMVYVEEDDNAGSGGGAIDVKWGGVVKKVELSGGIHDGTFSCVTNNEQFSADLPGRSPRSGIIVIRWIDTGTTVTYKVMTDAGVEFEGTLNGTMITGDALLYSELTWFECKQTDAAFWDRPISDADMDSIIAAYSQNFLTYVPDTGCNVAPPDPVERTGLVWNFEDDNFTWQDNSIDLTTELDPVVCMHYTFDPGFQTRWSDLQDLGVLWSDFVDQGTKWSDLYGGGRDQNMYWLADSGLYKSDQIVFTSGRKRYFVEKTNIDLDEALGLTSNMWKHIRQFYFHLQSNRSQVGTAVNDFTFTTGWSKNLMDAPDWRTPIVINLQATTNDGRHKVDLRTTGRYLALNMDFTSTSEFAMTGGDLDVEPSHGR